MEKKLKRLRAVALTAMIVLCAFLVLYGSGFVISLVMIVRMLLATTATASAAEVWGDMSGGQQVTGIASLLAFLGVVVLFVLALLLLRALIKKGSTPFTVKNVKLMKGMALVLVIIAAVILSGELLARALYRSMVVSEASSIGIIGGADGPTAIFVANYSSSGFGMSVFLLLAVAAVVWCLALAFEYGTLLQRQADETL